MHPFFAPLDARDLGTLIAALTCAGRAGLSAFAHLPQDRRAPLAAKAEQLLEIPADKRVALLVRELKEHLGEGGARGIERVDPSWLAHALRSESPRMVAVILAGLPQPLVRSVLRRLPAEVVSALPPRAQVERAPASLRRHLRRTFEGAFAPMPPPPKGPWRLTDCVHLERRQLATLVRDLGLVELGQAFASVGRMALLDLCRRLPRPAAEELVQAVRIAAHGHIPEAKEAQRFLSRVVVNFENTEEFLQRAGLWRLARALWGEPKEAVDPLLQRLPRRATLLLREFTAKVEELAPTEGEAQARLKDGVLIRVAWLFSEGPGAAAFVAGGLAYHDPEAARAALAEAKELARAVPPAGGPEGTVAASPAADGGATSIAHGVGDKDGPSTA